MNLKVQQEYHCRRFLTHVVEVARCFGLFRLLHSRQRLQIRIIFVLLLSLLFPSLEAKGQDSLISPEWKDHFRGEFVITNGVFRRALFSDEKRETNLYQFKYQESGFLMREIQAVTDAKLNLIPQLNVCAGGFLSNYWAIAPHDRLMLFPNADEMIKARNDGNAALVFAPRGIMFSALFYGINLIDPTTIKWLDATRFVGEATDGRAFSAHVLEISEKLPQLLEWHFDKNEKTHYFLEYVYDHHLGLSYYPNQIRLYRKIDGKEDRVLVATQEIIALETAPTAEPESEFDPKKYFKAPAFGLSTTVQTTNGEYAQMDDHTLEKIAPLSASSVQPDVLKKEVPLRARLLFFLFVTSSPLGMFILWKCMTSTNKKNKKETQ